MNHEYDLWVLGGDLRQAFLAQALARDGHRVHAFGLDRALSPQPNLHLCSTLDGLELAAGVVLPMPVADGDGMLYAPFSLSRTPLSAVLDQLQSRQVLCGGRLTPTVSALAKERGLSIIDLFSREELAVANAVPTAEGCLQLAMEHLPITIHGANVLVIGFGRVGKVCAQRFAALGAKITVAARKYDQLAWAEASGFTPQYVSQLTSGLEHMDLVINTVPTPILGEEELRHLSSDVLIIDLASAPGGVDRSAAEQLGRQVIWALSLPGKMAPATAGAILKDTLYHVLNERGLH